MQWKNPLSAQANYEKLVAFLLFAALVTTTFNIRYVNSLSIILLVMATLLHPRRLSLFKTAFSTPFFLACLALLLWHLAGYLYSKHPDEEFSFISSKAGLVAIPFFFCANQGITLPYRRTLTLVFGISLAIVSLICLFNAAWVYHQHGDPSVFFYHKLVSPFNHHAVLFSFFLLTCIIYWLEVDIPAAPGRKIKILLIILTLYFFLVTLLLSSKLVIVIMLIYLTYYLVRNSSAYRNKKYIWQISLGLFIVLVMIIITNGPIKKRFTDLKGNMYLFEQQEFSPEIYFNGVQFRLLNWRFTKEILDENHAWLLGVSPAGAQHELNGKFIASNMYRGNGSTDKGYIGYNCHNQFLQITLQSGIPGLFLFMLIFALLIWQVLRSGRRETMIMVIAIIAFCFTESLLETQYGVEIFTFFPLMGLYARDYRKLHS